MLLDDDAEKISPIAELIKSKKNFIHPNGDKKQA